MSKSIDPHSAGKPARIKPAKPHDEFPLFPHDNGSWAKKVRGKLEYFGPWEKPDDALTEWLRVKDSILAGRSRPPKGDGFTIRDLCNHFLTYKRRRVDSGELAVRSFNEYKTATDRVIEAFGKGRLVSDIRPDDFDQLRAKLAKTLGPIALGNAITKIRSVFLFAFSETHIDVPVRFGKSFAKPSEKTKRKDKAARRLAHGKRLFTPAELRKIIKAASPALRAMVMLGVNCGFGATDCAELPKAALDLKAGMVDFPRPKTGIERRAILWPETVRAIQAALKVRPQPKAKTDANQVFVTKYGHRWVKLGPKSVPDDAISKEFAKLLKELGIKDTGEKTGLGFYSLRRTFRTHADEARDTPAVDLIMGHVDDSMGGRYVEGISDDRLRAVSDHVHARLFPTVVRGSKKG